MKILAASALALLVGTSVLAYTGSLIGLMRR